MDQSRLIDWSDQHYFRPLSISGIWAIKQPGVEDTGGLNLIVRKGGIYSTWSLGGITVHYVVYVNCLPWVSHDAHEGKCLRTGP